MKKEAKKVLNTLPDEIWYTQEPWAGYLLDGDEWRQNQESCICRFSSLLIYAMGDYANKAGVDVLKKIECLKAMTQINGIITEVVPHDESDFITLSGGRAKEHIAIAELYCELGDALNALDYVEKGTQDALYYWNNVDKKAFHGYDIKTTPRNLCWTLWEDHLTKSQFDIIRNEERFIRCFDELKANSRELKQ